MRKTKKTLAILAIVAMVVAMLPVQAFAADSSALPTRLSGTTQYDTAATIAQQWTAPTKAVLAPGEKANLVDALAAGPLAAALDAPILLTDGKTLTDATKAALATVKTVYVVSGTAVIKQAVIDQLTAMGITVKNTYGAEAPDTSVAIAKAMAADAGVSITQVALANGAVGAQDAMSIASFAGAAKMPILVTDNAATLPASVSAYLASLTGVTKRYVVGGTAVISDAEKAAFGTADRLAGATAYDTNDAVIKALATSFNNVFIANGVTLVDALAGAPLAAKKGAAIVLTDGTNATAAAYVNTKLSASSVVTALGGEAVVPAAVAAKVAYTAPAALAVSSVSQLNADQVQVVFNKAVDSDTAEDIANYAIQLSGDAAPQTLDTVDATATAALQDDGQTVIITATTSISASWGALDGAPYNFVVNKLGVEDEGGTAIASKFVQLLVNSDSTAPKLLSASSSAATSTKTVTLTFSEPVDLTTGVFVINGKSAGVVAGSTPVKVKATAQDNLLAGSSYTVNITNLADLAGNLIDPNPATLTFTVGTDTTNAGVTSATVSGDKKVNVVFGEKMDATTVTTGTINVLDANGNSVGGVYTVAATAGDTTGAAFTITFTNASIFNSAGVANLQIVFTSSIKDPAGNAMTAVTKNVTINKDTTAPTISSVQWVKAGGTYDSATYANGAFVVTASEKLAAQATITRANLVVVDQDGTDQTNTIFNVTPIVGVVADSNDSSKKVIPLAVAMPSTVDTVYIRFADSTFTDASLGANGLTATVINNIDVTTGLGDSTDVTKPVLAAAAGHTAGGVNTITYTITEANLDTSSALNLNNYRLDGATLPADTYITLAGAAPYTVTIHLPQGSVSDTRSNYAFTVNGIKDDAGNVASPLASSSIALTDNTQPVLQSAKINSDGTITATFSEDVTGAVASDFVVKLNGSTINAAQTTVAAITSGADNGAELIKVKASFDDPDATASSGDETIYIDVDNSGTLNAGDITLATGTYASAAAYNGGFVKASDIVALVVKTKSTTCTGADADGNTFKTATSITVK